MDIGEILSLCICFALGVVLSWMGQRIFYCRSTETRLARALLNFKNQAESEGHSVIIGVPPSANLPMSLMPKTPRRQPRRNVV